MHSFSFSISATVAVYLCQIILKVVRVLDSLFLQRVVAVFYLEFLYQLIKFCIMLIIKQIPFLHEPNICLSGIGR